MLIDDVLASVVHWALTMSDEDCDARALAAEVRRLSAAVNELDDLVRRLTAERDALRQAAMRLLSATVNAQTEGGAADPRGALRAVQEAEGELEGLIPAEAWAKFHAERGDGR